MFTDKIMVLTQPNSTYNVEPGQVINIGVDATTDAEFQNQMSYEWSWYRPEKDQETGETTFSMCTF